MQGLAPHQQRVLVELRELSEKQDALKLFLRSEMATRIDQDDLDLLALQLTVMTAYAQVLAARVKRFEVDAHPMRPMDHILTQELRG